MHVISSMADVTRREFVAYITDQTGLNIKDVDFTDQIQYLLNVYRVNSATDLSENLKTKLEISVKSFKSRYIQRWKEKQIINI